MKIRTIIKRMLERNNEEKILKKILRAFKRDISILDVGCGFGEKMKFIQSLGFTNITGVDINKELVTSANANDLHVLHVDELDEINSCEFDLILFSHVIEHFSYTDLINFMEKYLDYCREDGSVLIVTPLMTNFFYDDFDHVKPYHPNGIEHVFSGSLRQVQLLSRYKLTLIDIMFRKMPFNLFKFNRQSYLGKINYIVVIVNLLMSILNMISMGTIGRVTGWVGLYKCSKNLKS